MIQTYVNQITEELVKAKDNLIRNAIQHHTGREDIDLDAVRQHCVMRVDKDKNETFCYKGVPLLWFSGKLETSHTHTDVKCMLAGIFQYKVLY